MIVENDRGSGNWINVIDCPELIDQLRRVSAELVAMYGTVASA